MTVKEIEIIFREGDSQFRYSSVDVSGDHVSCLTDDDMLDPSDPKFVEKCMHSIKPIYQEGSNWNPWIIRREFSTDGRGYLYRTYIGKKLMLEETEAEYIKRNTPRKPPTDHQIHGFGSV